MARFNSAWLIDKRQFRSLTGIGKTGSECDFGKTGSECDFHWPARLRRGRPGGSGATRRPSAAAVMELAGAAEDIARTCHAHTTLSEAVMEAAALAAFGKTIHL